jgi:hypothetical protein
MKHIDIGLRFVKRAQASGIIDARYVNTKEKVADIFTKPFSHRTFQYLREKFGLIDVVQLSKQ